MNTIVPIDREGKLESLNELTQQVEAMLKVLARDLTDGHDAPFAPDAPDAIDERGKQYSKDEEGYHIWEDAIMIATLRAIAAGVDDPAAWATQALRTRAVDFDHWYA